MRWSKTTDVNFKDRAESQQNVRYTERREAAP